MHQRRPEQVQGEHGRFGVFVVGAGQVAVSAVEEHGVAGVPLLDDLQPAVKVNLAAQRW